MSIPYFKFFPKSGQAPCGIRIAGPRVRGGLCESVPYGMRVRDRVNTLDAED